MANHQKNTSTNSLKIEENKPSNAKFICTIDEYAIIFFISICLNVAREQ